MFRATIQALAGQPTGGRDVFLATYIALSETNFQCFRTGCFHSAPLKYLYIALGKQISSRVILILKIYEFPIVHVSTFRAA